SCARPKAPPARTSCRRSSTRSCRKRDARRQGGRETSTGTATVRTPSMPRLLAALLCLGLPAAAQAAPAAAGKDAYPGYERRTVQGFTVLLNDEVLKHDADPRWKRKPTDVLDLELRTICAVLPERTVRLLRRLVIWVEWEDRSDPDAGRAVAKY